MGNESLGGFRGMNRDRDKLSINVAKLYYRSDYSQQRIAEELGISRPSVSRLLQYAKDKGWNSEYKAITQGAYIISKEYIQQGQYTLYLQKFDIGCKGWRTCLAHQYQQNF